MNQSTTQTLSSVDEMRHTLRRISHLKGRQPDAQSLQEVRAHVSSFERSDLLIEHLHALNDAYRGLYERHLVALAHEMRLSMAEVFEVADAAKRVSHLVNGAERVCVGLSHVSL